MSEELKPCPFCGGEATCYHHDEEENGWVHQDWVSCKDEDCGAQTCLHATSHEAIAAWNRRPETPASGESDSGLVERLTRELHQLATERTRKVSDRTLILNAADRIDQQAAEIRRLTEKQTLFYMSPGDRAREERLFDRIHAAEARAALARLKGEGAKPAIDTGARRELLARAIEALEALLACPEIADCDPRDKDPETHVAERKARAALARLKGEGESDQPKGGDANATAVGTASGPNQPHATSPGVTAGASIDTGARRELLARAIEALEALLACPEIADCDPRDKDPETHVAERKARAALARLKGEGWMPIESAPRDGTAILAYDPIAKWTVVVAYSYVTKWPWEMIGGERQFSGTALTHWMPLPEPPTPPAGE